MAKCKCGCGETVSPGRKYIQGHHCRNKSAAHLENLANSIRAWKPRPYCGEGGHPCACGCGEIVPPHKKYARFHHLRVKTPEHIAKLKVQLVGARQNISQENVTAATRKFWASPEADAARAKASARWKGKSNPLWNASGKCLNKCGRVYIKVPGFGRDGWQARHRRKAELALGRSLKKGEVVHHIDENKLNDRNTNLLICTDSYHKMLHRKMLKLKNEGRAWWLRSS